MVSVLFAPGVKHAGKAPEPACFADLNLDQLIDAVVAGRDRYELKPFFYAPVRDVDGVRFRHEVFRDLDDGQIRAAMEGFAAGMRSVRNMLAQSEKLRYREQKQRWFLDALTEYSATVMKLNDVLAAADVRSQGLQSLGAFLTGYVPSADFIATVSRAEEVMAGLADVRYTVHVRDARVTVSRPESTADFSAEVAAVFERFASAESESHLARFPAYEDMNHVEGQILRRIAMLFPEPFTALSAFCDRHHDFIHPVVAGVEREIQFYLAYRDLMHRVAGAGLPFCFPEVSTDAMDLDVEDGFDLALANRLPGDGTTVVTNDVRLTRPERILVVTGPNQGGKTTFARMVGQLHYLAGLGVPVPARRATMFLPDQVFTHFEREESLSTLWGKLEDELERIHDVLVQSTRQSVIVMNESFTSTTLDDATFIGRRILQQITELGALAVYVTFVDELASLNDATVSMVAEIDPNDPDQRTFHMLRRRADGLAYAAALATKHGLTFQRLRERVAA